MTANIFFINLITFFISFSHNINFTAVGHIEYRNAIYNIQILKEEYMYYSKRGFKITTLHVDVEVGPLQELIQEIPGGTRVNL